MGGSGGRRHRLGGLPGLPPLSRRELLKAGGLALTGALLPVGEGLAAPAPSRPNLLVFFTDDQNPGCVGYASAGKLVTPHIDRLAKAGTVFEATYAGAVPCAPSRASFMTGLHGHRWKATGLGRLRPGEWTWAHALREAGYHTALVGKMHFQPMRAYHGFEHAEYCEHRYSRAPRKAEDDYERWLRENGIERYRGAAGLWPDDPGHHPISWLRDRSIAYLEARKEQSAPFCLLASFRDPHDPCTPVPEAAGLYQAPSISVRRDEIPEAGALPDRLLRAMYRAPRIQRWNDASQGEETLRRYLYYYYGVVSQIDAAVGAIVEHVDLQNTLVLFTSDHGHYLGWRGLLGKEPFVGFEPVGRVPFFACGAGVPGGATVRHPTSLVDVAPTVLHAAGVDLPRDLDGRPLQDYFADPETAADRAVFCRGLPGRTGGFDALRRGPYKYFRGQEDGEELVFDLTTDPDERHDLGSSPDLKQVRKELAGEMDAILARREHTLPRFA